jgi:hypothetical protein
MKYIQYLFASILLFFVPIHGLLIAVAMAIILDTFTGVFKSIKIHGLKSIRSRKLSTIVSKMLLYEVTVLFLFLMDKYLLNEFVSLISCLMMDRDPTNLFSIFHRHSTTK